MSRRFTGHMNGERYLADTSPLKREVHDLDQETSQCQIDEIIRAAHNKLYHTASQARADGFRNCAYCLGQTNRRG